MVAISKCSLSTFFFWLSKNHKTKITNRSAYFRSRQFFWQILQSTKVFKPPSKWKIRLAMPVISKLKNFWELAISTDLGSLIGKFDCRYSTVLNFGSFLASLILREINSGWFQKVKNCYFANFEGFEVWFLEKFHT